MNEVLEAQSVGADRYYAVSAFLFHEAELLDDRRLVDWLALLDPAIDYRVPTRSTHRRGSGSEFSTKSFYLVDTYASLSTRVERFQTDFAFSEDPPSRTRRIIGNVRIEPNSDNSALLTVKSNLLLFRGRHDGESHFLSAERRDHLRVTDGSFRIAQRTVFLDHVTFPMENLAIFL